MVKGNLDEVLMPRSSLMVGGVLNGGREEAEVLPFVMEMLRQRKKKEEIYVHGYERERERRRKKICVFNFVINK